MCVHVCVGMEVREMVRLRKGNLPLQCHQFSAPDFMICFAPVISLLPDYLCTTENQDRAESLYTRKRYCSQCDNGILMVGPTAGILMVGPTAGDPWFGCFDTM